jgi:hypothetical protein
MRKQAAALARKAAPVIDKGKTAEDRKKELEMQRAAAAAARQSTAGDKSKKVQIMALGGDSIKSKLDETAARKLRRQRLAPSLNDLLKRVFAWDFNDITDSQRGSKVRSRSHHLLPE